MTPSNPSLDALLEIARAATPGDWECWDSLYEGMKAAIVVPGAEPLKTLAEVRSNFADAQYFATFDPPTVISLLERVKALEEALERLRAYAASVWFDEATATNEERELMREVRALTTEATDHA